MVENKPMQRSKSMKILVDYKNTLIVFLIMAFIMLLYVGFVHHLDTRVYQPIGTISSEAADKAKWEAIIIGLPYILLALIGYILTPLFLLLAICFENTELQE